MMFFIIMFFIRPVGSRNVPLIFGGEDTTALVYPYQVFLDIQGKGDWICGGSLVNQIFVLTAAHCLEDLKNIEEPKVYIKYGSEILKNAKLRRMKSYEIHQKYDFETMFADLAIIQCRRAVHLGDHVKRVAIMRSPPVEHYAYVAGWGVVDEYGTNTEILKHVKQKIYSNDICITMNLPDGTFCAGNAGIKDDIAPGGYPSLGDSGGPLVIKGFIQIGLVSYRLKGFTIVAYTNVSYFMPWIRRYAYEMHCPE